MIDLRHPERRLATCEGSRKAKSPYNIPCTIHMSTY